MTFRVLTIAAATTAGLALSACQPQAPKPATDAASTQVPAAATAATGPLAYSATPSLEGGFFPADTLKSGTLHFAGVYIDRARAFGSWASGDHSGGPPIAIRFLDERLGYSAQTDGPPDDKFYVTVEPTTYAVSDTHVAFTGTSAATGPVTFKADVDQSQLAASQQRDDGGLIVATGTLTVDGQTFSNLKLFWNNPHPG